MALKICPQCNELTVKSRFTWRALLYGIICFPFGLYCCLKRREWYCTKCHFEIIVSPNNDPSNYGYQYRNLYGSLSSSGKGIPPNSAYKNTVCTDEPSRAQTLSCSSSAHLINQEP